MLDAFRSLISPALSIVQILPQAEKVVLVARRRAGSSCCPACGGESRSVHSHYDRRLSDLPWYGRAVEVRLQSRRFRCGNAQCPQRVFTERLSDVVRPKARRTVRLAASQLAIGFAVGGEPGFRLSHKLAMPVSGDTLLRMIRAAEMNSPKASRVVGIDDWAWRKGQRYGTIICDLERGRILELLPDRNADTVASWLERYPGIEIIARDRAGLYAEGARRGAPQATQVADRWHLLNNLGEALRVAVGRHRKAVRVAAKAWSTEMDNQTGVDLTSSEADAKHGDLRRLRRDERRDRYADILNLRQAGLSPRQIAPRIGMSVRTVERWLATRRQEPSHDAATPQRRSPSRRVCAWLLSEEPNALDNATQRFLHYLFEHAPELKVAGELARRFAALIRSDDEAALEHWIADAAGTELDALAKGIRRDIDAGKSAITYPWSTSSVEGRINRLKTLKR